MTWPEEMGEEDRVRSVASTLREPRGIEWIATRANIDVETAQEVVEQMETVESVRVDGETRFRPNVTAKRERTREEFGQKSESDLRELRNEIENELREWENGDEIDKHRRREREYLLAVIEDVMD